jgi:CheY-like chemotaxis protein
MELRHLCCFVAVVEELSFTKATVRAIDRSLARYAIWRTKSGCNRSIAPATASRSPGTRPLLSLDRPHLSRGMSNGIRPGGGQACCVSDLCLPDLGGIALLKRMRQLNPEVEVVLITGHGSGTASPRRRRNETFRAISKSLCRSKKAVHSTGLIYGEPSFEA